MIFARGEHGEEKLLIIGLSAANVRRLLLKKPILIRREIHGDAVPDDWKIMIMAGETEEDIVTELKRRGLIGEDANMIVQKNLGTTSDT